MMNEFLQISAQLFKHLQHFPEGDERTPYIEKINQLLDERGGCIEKLQQQNFKYDPENPSHKMLQELDKGINERLQFVFTSVKEDLKELQLTKKHEQQYIDPYSSLRNLDGRYFDGKK